MSFDHLAPLYRPLEGLLAGRLMQRCRTAFLPHWEGGSQALLLGEGPGRFLEALVRRIPGMEITVLERSPAMIREARRSLPEEARSRVRFVAADVRTWQPPRVGYDLITSQFFLDCFRSDEVAEIVARISQAASERAQWWVADFRVPRRGWRNARARIIHRAMYTVFRSTTDLTATEVSEPDPYLRRAGFRVEARRFFNFGLLYAAQWRRGS